MKKFAAESNGLAERTIKTVKRVLKKVKQSGTDQHLALLISKEYSSHWCSKPCKRSKRVTTMWEQKPCQNYIQEVPYTLKQTEDRNLRGHSRLIVSKWSEEDVLAWLWEEGLEDVIYAFKSNNIDGEELLSPTKESLSSELPIKSLGLRSKVMKKIEDLKMAPVSKGTHDEYLCPITRKIVKDPVIAADGYSYEREAIESWITMSRHTSPMTNLSLQTTLLTPNRTLKMAISRWTTSQ
ncbi:WD repeat, SAM and U-box domain-containing protein 1-like [Xyrauchen texanus]|uniref:WD repeat, SAM and U-box domain-containing protein 1-like n=1 Tax=Xyrauchen texanus TaxID=154827 RepID=UPI002241B850|nr:WD repeat, SAM and U-box domain-containing protein 1-like [Xyrauchen texanus]